MTADNSSFSTLVPGLQLAWDSTSLTALKECPRKYQLSIVEGWAPRAQSVHLTFGILIHEGKERYDRSLASGADHDTAVIDAIEHVLLASWDRELGRPQAVLCDDPNKNRATLVRTLVWYFEEYRDDPVRTVTFADGRPAVELSFSFETDYWTQPEQLIGPYPAPRERFLLCGHIDRLGELNGTVHPCDVKTSKHTISESFFLQFTPHTQFSLYSFATKVLFAPDRPLGGLIVDAAQVAVTFSRFERREIPRSPEYLSDWYNDLGAWLRMAEQFAREGHWPMNESSCDKWGGCQFRRVCSHSPSARAEWLRADFIPRVWDPLKVRGDI